MPNAIPDQLKPLTRALLRVAKRDRREPARVGIIGTNLKFLEAQPDNAGLKRLIVSQIDDLSALLRQEAARRD